MSNSARNDLTNWHTSAKENDERTILVVICGSGEVLIMRVAINALINYNINIYLFILFVLILYNLII